MAKKKQGGLVTTLCTPYRQYLVAADRTTVYRVLARNGEEAIALMMDGTAEEVDGVTHKISAVIEKCLDGSPVR